MNKPGPQLFLKVPLRTIFLVKVPFYDNGTRDMCQESGEKEEYPCLEVSTINL